MQKKSLKNLFAAIFFISVSCAGVKDPHILSHLKNVQVFERQDHKFCDSLKLNFDKSDNLKSGLYWRCRLSLAKYRLYTDSRLPEQAKHNLEISDLVTKISLKLSETPESMLLRENKKIDSRQHRQCLVMGFEIETEDQTKIDDYFACRKALIEDQRLVPPFGNIDYLKHSNRFYDLGFVIDQRVDVEISRYNEAKKNYPTCIKFNLKNINFKNCVAAQDRSRQCFAEIDKKKFKKEAEEKITCQKQSYIEFPDNFLKEDDLVKADISRMKASSDYYNQRSFASLGIDGTQFDADKKRVQEDELERQKKAEQNINSKDGLYSKFELTKLRQKYIFSCQKEANTRIERYSDDLKISCEDQAKFELVGEI